MEQAERFLVEEHDAGMRLDQFVKMRMPAFSRARLQSSIREGGVTVNAKIICRTSQPLCVNDEVAVIIPTVSEPSSLVAQELPLDILYEDQMLLVLNKPAGLVVHPGAGNRERTLVNALLHHCAGIANVGGIERPGIVHRLDKETSGCLVVAKCDAAHHSLSKQFAERTIKKTYIALVEGIPRMSHGVISAPIARHKIHRQKMAVSERGREATTFYRVLASNKDWSLIECSPQTGRTHQIRVHLKHIGHPVVGDGTYGHRSLHTRHYLHAWKIQFIHPQTCLPMIFTAPLPFDFPCWAIDVASAQESSHSLDKKKYP